MGPLPKSKQIKRSSFRSDAAYCQARGWDMKAAHYLSRKEVKYEKDIECRRVKKLLVTQRSEPSDSSPSDTQANITLG